MEHRYSPRRNIHLKAILVTHEGNHYVAEVTEFSSNGLRVVVEDALPENIKLVEVLLFRLRSSVNDTLDSIVSLKMLVARRQGNVIGLCVFNEQDRIPQDFGIQNDVQPGNLRLLANSR